MGVAAIPVVMTAVSAASSAYSFYQQDQMAKAQAIQQQKHNEAVHDNMIEQYSEMSKGERQAIRNNLEDSIEAQKEQMRRESSINLLSSASGTTGVSVGQLLLANQSEGGKSLDTLLRNREVVLDNFRNQASGIRRGGIQQTDSRVLERPSLLAGALETASAAGSGYLTGSDISDRIG